MRGLLLGWDDLVLHRCDCMSLVCFDVTECGVRFVRLVPSLEELLYSRERREPPGAWRPIVEARSIELNLH